MTWGAAPGVILWLFCQSRANGIALDITDRCPEMGVIERTREEPALPHAAAPLVFVVYVLGIAQKHRLQRPLKRVCIHGARDEMDMVWHDAVGVHQKPMLVGIGLEQRQKQVAIFIDEEYLLATIAALRDMVRAIRDNDSRDSGHDTQCSHGKGRVQTDKRVASLISTNF